MSGSYPTRRLAGYAPAYPHHFWCVRPRLHNHLRDSLVVSPRRRRHLIRGPPAAGARVAQGGSGPWLGSPASSAAGPFPSVAAWPGLRVRAVVLYLVMFRLQAIPQLIGPGKHVGNRPIIDAPPFQMPGAGFSAAPASVPGNP